MDLQLQGLKSTISKEHHQISQDEINLLVDELLKKR